MKPQIPKKRLEQARKLIDSVSWTHARPPRTEEYIVYMRSKKERKIFDFLNHLIKDFGYVGFYLRTKYRYVDVDRYKYWVIWPILNRELLSIRSDGMGYKIAGKDDLVRALTSIASNLPEKYIEMLRVHYRAPGHIATSSEIAVAIGWRYQGVNRHYARLAALIMDFLNVPEIKTEEDVGYLVEFIGWPKRGKNPIKWKMKPELVAALEELKWT